MKNKNTHKIDIKEERKIQGKYRDVIVYKDGTVIKKPSKDIKFNNNLIVNTAGDYMAGLFMGDPDYLTNYGNIHYAIGNGETSWDSETDFGKSHELPTVTDLFNETYRCLPTTKIYIDGWDGSPTAPNKSNFIRLIYELDDTVAVNEYLREFGLYCNGTSTAGSGLLFDFVIHEKFRKTSDIFMIYRYFEIRF